MAVSTYLANELLDHVLRNSAYTPPTTVYLALFTTVPDADNAGGVEVVGGSYARLAVTFAAAADAMAASSTTLTFTNMPAATLAGAGLMDASTAGNLLFFGDYAALHVVAAGAEETLSPGDLIAVFH